MGATVHAIDDEMQPVTHLVASKTLADTLIRLGLPPALRTATLTWVRKDCVRGLTRVPRLREGPGRMRKSESSVAIR